MDSLLAGTLILPWRVHCAGMMSSAALPCRKHSGHRESHSGLRRKPFAFPPESLFAFSPESCSPSPRNAFQVRPGILFALPRNPQMTVTGEIIGPHAGTTVRVLEVSVTDDRAEVRIESGEYAG